MKPLSEEQITAALTELEGWSYNDNAIQKDFSFANFKQAMAFMVRVGFEAEAHQHHPNLANVYNSVSISLQTHDAGNKVTQKDLDLAKAIESADH
ncbi:MAG: 4a-hydroxytetrahydrobiopterin dehydratase [Balneolaceae bacterium]